jgi:hypothetical protein
LRHDGADKPEVSEPPALGEKLLARGEVLTTGRRLFVCKVEVVANSNGEETSCAALQQTISLTRPKPNGKAPEGADQASGRCAKPLELGR